MPKKPSNKEFKRVFDKVANRYDHFSNRYAVERRIEFIKKYAKGKCLEVGAGSGEISKALLLNHTVIATDISPKMVDVIKKKLKIKAYASDAEKLPFPDRSFDTIVGAEMLYYLDNPQKFVLECVRLLRPNGRLILTSASKLTELYDRARAILRKVGLASMYFDDPNKSFMTKEEISKILAKYGFKIKKIKKTVIFPFRIFDPLNRLLENTLLSNLGAFIFVYAEKDRRNQTIIRA